MENCYKMYAWLCRTMVAIMLEMFWKMRQIADYFGQPESEDTCQIAPLPSEFRPLTKELKFRRHIRSMSDVQRSTPLHKIPVSSLRRISQPILYDNDRTRRFRPRERYYESSDSCSDHQEWKTRTLEKNLRRYRSSADSMRYL